MRTGTELILATKAFAKDEPARSWSALISTSLLLLLAIAGTIWNFHWIAALACSLVTGLLIVRLFVMYHDQQHNAILEHSKLADVLMRIFGILTLNPSSVWRHSHNHHHHHNSKLRGSNIGSFPIMTKDQFQKSSPRERALYLAMRHPLTILFGYFTTFLYSMCLAPFLDDPKEHRDGLIAIIVHLALAIGITFLLGWQGLLLTLLIPYFFMDAVGTYLFYAQHNFPGVSFNEKSGWTYEKAALESSSYMRMSPIMAWFTGNIGYHHVHHLNAKIPFYRLPEVMAAIPELQSPKMTSLSPAEILRCLRLKVWDVSSQQMVPVPKDLAAAPIAPAKPKSDAKAPAEAPLEVAGLSRSHSQR